MEDCGNSRIFYSMFTSRNGKSGHNVSFDNVTAEHKEVRVERRNTPSIVDPDKAQKEHDHVAEECDKIEDENSNVQLKSQREFNNLTCDAEHSTNGLAMKCEDKKNIGKNGMGHDR